MSVYGKKQSPDDDQRQLLLAASLPQGNIAHKKQKHTPPGARLSVIAPKLPLGHEHRKIFIALVWSRQLVGLGG